MTEDNVDEHGRMSLDPDTDFEIHSRVALGGLDISIETKNVPEQLGAPLFQLTFFINPERGLGHVLVSDRDDMNLLVVHQVLIAYMQRTAQYVESAGFVPQDIVDRFPDEPQA